MKKLLFIFALLGNIICLAQEKQDMEKINELLAGMSTTVQNEYTFPVLVDMTMINYEKGKAHKPTQTTILINNEKQLFATKMNDDKAGSMLMVVDQGNDNIVMLNEKHKTAMAININAFMATNNYMPKGEQPDVDCKKTGKIKTIAGYVCEEYICTYSERNGRYEIYVTDKVKFDFGKNEGRSNPFAEYFNKASSLGGMMMEGKFYENDELQASVAVNSVNTRANYKINTKGYKRGM